MPDDARPAALSPASNLPSPPRPITAAARRGATSDLAPRAARMLGFVLIGALAIVSIKAVNTERAERQLMREGARHEALVVSVADRTDPSPVSREIALGVRVRYDLPEGPRELRGTLPPRVGALIRPGETLPIVVDRRGLEWREVADPRNWVSVLATPLVLSPIAILAFLVARLLSRKTLNIYAHGTPALGRVHEVNRPALAPDIRILRVSRLDADDRRIFSVSWPRRLGDIPRGSDIDLIAHPTQPNRAIAMRAFTE